MSNNQTLTKKEFTDTLGEFTEKTLLPAVSDMMDEKLNNHPTKQDLRSEFAHFDEKMDEKLADLKGDLTVLMRKEDKKLVALIALLKNKQVISEEEVKQILALEPFPQS